MAACATAGLATCFSEESRAQLADVLKVVEGARAVRLIEQLLRADALTLVTVEGEAAVASHLRRDRGQVIDLRPKAARRRFG